MAVLKVPRIALGTVVNFPGAINKDYEGEFVVAEINHMKRTFNVEGFTAQHLLTIDKDYFPVANRANLHRAIEQWNSDYRNSDNPRRYDEGKAQEEAIKQMLVALPPEDQLFHRKLIILLTQ